MMDKYRLFKIIKLVFNRIFIVILSFMVFIRNLIVMFFNLMGFFSFLNYFFFLHYFFFYLILKKKKEKKIYTINEFIFIYLMVVGYIYFFLYIIY